MDAAVDLRSLKDKMRRRLPAGSSVLQDLLQEPDAMAADRAAVLIPHYLRRLERELETYQVSSPAVLARP